MLIEITLLKLEGLYSSKFLTTEVSNRNAASTNFGQFIVTLMLHRTVHTYNRNPEGLAIAELLILLQKRGAVEQQG